MPDQTLIHEETRTIFDEAVEDYADRLEKALDKARAEIYDESPPQPAQMAEFLQAP